MDEPRTISYMRKKRLRIVGRVHRMDGMEILKRLMKVQVKGRRKLLDKEQNDNRKCTRALDLWGLDTRTRVQSHWTVEELANRYLGSGHK